MRRAIAVAILGLCILAFLPRPLPAEIETVKMIDGIGLVDYSRKPDFKIGDWTQYRLTANTAMGLKDDYVVTLLVSGEERFWGDDGFWIETWMEPKGRPRTAVASLMSYSIFDDSLAIPHVQNYARKLVTEMEIEGRPLQNVRKRPDTALRERNTSPAQLEWHTDTLGVDTVMVPRGTFKCLKVRVRFGVRATTEVRDSTHEDEVEEHRTLYKTLDIPVTSIVREDIEKWIRRRSWKAGQSKDAPMITREHSVGVARLMDYGHDLKARMTPVEFQRPIRRPGQPAQNAAPVRSRKPTGKKKTG